MQSMRPRVQLDLPFSRDTFYERAKQRLTLAECPCTMAVLGDNAEVKIAEHLAHFWSPQLNLEVQDQPDGTAILNGHFGPRANVWTMFLAAYAFLFFGALFGSMLGLAQLTIGQPAWGLLAIPVASGLAVVPYVASLIGQRLAIEQMQLLHSFLQESMALEPDPVELDVLPAPAPQVGLGEREARS